MVSDEELAGDRAGLRAEVDLGEEREAQARSDLLRVADAIVDVRERRHDRECQQSAEEPAGDGVERHAR